MDYTRYALKSSTELESLLAGKDKLFVIACNKCFQQYSSTALPELDTLLALADAQGKHVTGTARLDFLCNRVQSEKKLKDALGDGTENVVVIACGLGVQTVADFLPVPVFTAADSLNYAGHPGMALTQKTCGACAQCFLNVTGGICPITDCSKSLVNGPCGGAKNGRCEIDPKKDCAWDKILQRLAKQGRTKEFLSQNVLLRDYNAVSVESVKAYVKQARERRFEGFYGGVHPAEHKESTAHLPLRRFPAPDTVVIPLSMHAGAPATPIVQVGQTVKLGQKIAEQVGFISAPVHSSVSGTVLAIEPRAHAAKGSVLSVVIRNDKKDTLDETVVPAKPLDELCADEIVQIVREKGIVGMGGATFPASVKLKPGRPIDYVLLNGSECESYLTADHRIMLEYADDVIFGTRAILKAVGAPQAVILIEDNKPDAIERMQKAAAPYEAITVCAAKTQYPEGAEKMLIKKVTGRQVPSGKLPADVGCVVSNVSTARAIADAIQTGMPLVERAVTVTGERIGQPGNFLVRLGTGVQELIDFCGGITEADTTIKMGGPMMGTVLTNTDVPVHKGTNGIIAIPADHTAEQPCMKCGRCVDVCPMELEPLEFVKYGELGNAQALLQRSIMDCFSCKCCEYICPSRIPLVKKIADAKALAAPLLKKP